MTEVTLFLLQNILNGLLT